MVHLTFEHLPIPWVLGGQNTLLPLKWRERKSKSEKSLNFSAFFFASLPNGRIKLNELEVPLGLNEAAFCGGLFPVPPGGEGRNEPRGICGHSCVCGCEGSVGVCVCVCVCVNLASGKSRSQVAGMQTLWVQLGCSGSLTGFLLCTWWLNHGTLRPMGFPWRWDLVLEHQAALCSSE